MHQFFNQGCQLKNEAERVLVAASLNYEEILIHGQRVLAGKQRFEPRGDDPLTDVCHIDRSVYGFGEYANRWEAITEMVHSIYEGGSVSRENIKNTITSVIRRETSMSTGVGFGIAIPHTSSDLTPDLSVGYFYAQKGNNWDALDNQPVHYLACFIVPQGQFQKHLHTLAKIAVVLHKQDFGLTPPSTLEEWRSRIGYWFLCNPHS